MAKKTQQPTETNEPQGRKVPKEISIKLSKQQVDQRFQQAANLTQERQAVEKEFEAADKEWKQHRAEYKNRIKNLLAQADKLQAEAKEGKALTTENVILVLNHAANAAEYWFKPDGGKWEIVDTRPLEDNERQLTMMEDRVNKMPETGQTLEV